MTSESKERAISLQSVEQALSRVRPHVLHTPLMPLPDTVIDMIRHVAKDVANVDSSLHIQLKCENFQRGGAFKLRGATNAVRGTLESNPSVKIVATHSSGNHGIAIALAAKSAGLESIIVVPNDAAQCKVDDIREFGGQIKFSNPNEREKTLESVIAEKRALHGNSGIEVIPSYNHPLVMAGQGTLALEIVQDFPQVDLVVCPVGGGGLISGVSTVIKSKCPNAVIIGVEPTEANDAQQSLKAGCIIPNKSVPNTIADGLRTNLGCLTWECIKDLVDAVVDVSEAEISRALHTIMSRMKIVIEPSSAVVVAALLSPKFWKLEQVRNKRNIVAIISGGNVDLSNLSSIVKMGGQE